MSQRKEAIRIDAGMSGRLAKQARLRAQSKNARPAVKGWSSLVAAGVLLIGCVTLALGVACVKGLSKTGAVNEALTVEPSMPVTQPIALAVTLLQVSNAVVAVQASDSPHGLPVKRVLAEPERAKGPMGQETHASLFARLDANRDGFVSFAEYAALARNKQKHRGQILALDKDKDGRITDSEFRRVGAKQLMKWLDVQE